MQKCWNRAQLIPALVVVLAVLLPACGSSGGNDNSSRSEKSSRTSSGGTSVLGTPNKATGTPVKIGLITNGVGQGFDQHDDAPVAKAAANWINEYQGGIAGHPIDLTVCEDKNDPSTAVDCANQLIRQNVAAVVYSSNGIYEASWRPLSAAGIPTFIQAVTAKDAVKEATNTFTIQNGFASTVDGPIGLALAHKAKVLSVLAIDVPAATNNYRNPPGPQKIKDAGLELQLVTAPFGAPDMTVQAQQIVKKNPDGALNILGNDAFCIAALNGLKAAGYKGVISANEQCITENTVKAVGSDLVKGIRVITNIPLNQPEDPSTRLYSAILAKWAPSAVPLNGAFVFLAMTGLSAATRGMSKGSDVTPATVTKAAKTMDWVEQAGTGGRHMRCNGKADPTQPAVCQNALIYGTLNGNGKAQSYEIVNDTKIPD